MKKKTKRSKKIELLTKITDMMMLNQVKKEKTKRKSPNPTLGGTIDHFGKTIQKTKGHETSISDH
jgi:hypothetical protein